jgi:hypothetical protein
MNKKHPLNYEEFCEHVIKQIMAGRLSLDLFRDKLSLEKYEELKKIWPLPSVSQKQLSEETLLNLLVDDLLGDDPSVRLRHALELIHCQVHLDCRS